MSAMCYVSILTGPEGPVQLPVALLIPSHPALVSILTGPEGPVQLDCSVEIRTGTEFQSSPAPKDRCNAVALRPQQVGRQFQSSPAPKDRCNGLSLWSGSTSTWVSILTGPEGPVQLREEIDATQVGLAFQSSPAPKDRCNSVLPSESCVPTEFQSSPAPKDRCNFRLIL